MVGGVMLRPVSSTTSHPGIVEYNGQWYITYHTADARNGGHFRRSVAIDVVEWDDRVSLPRIKLVVPTGGAPFEATPIANIRRMPGLPRPTHRCRYSTGYGRSMTARFARPTAA